MSALLHAELLGEDYVGLRPVEAFLAATLLDGPWADEAVPSQVAVDEDDRVVGFLAAHHRRMRLGDREISVACCSHLAVAEGARGGAAGALLLRRVLQGPQDLTISDTAIDVVARAFQVFGGHVDVARSFEWLHVLRPGTLAARLGRRRLTPSRGESAGRRHQPVAPDLPLTALPLHVAGRVVPRLSVTEDPEVTRVPADPAEVARVLPEILRGFRLRPDYDEAYLRWLLAEIDAEVEGELVHRMVVHGGRPIGWFVYQRLPSGRGRVLQVAADPRRTDAVVGALFVDARERRCTMLSGRLEPHLRDALRRRLSVIGFGPRHVVHTRDDAILAALHGQSALTSRLDGEWW